ncbi:MAG TPA: hypothetical protein VFD77_00505 [Brumimicrobium sp.]|nr:hypothetical protein [Brumimicrobium sp.]
MNNNTEDIKLIRSMMEQSSRFISLSGWSGIFAGIYALIAATITYFLFWKNDIDYFNHTTYFISFDLVTQLFLIGLITLILAVSTGIILSVRKSKKKQLQIWNHVTKRLLIHLFVPLLSGGLFCLALYLNGIVGLIAPTMLIFYGLALLNASKFTFPDIAYLGYCELSLGMIGLFFVDKGLLLWAIGFGLLHIVYGIYIQRKYH